MKRKDKKQEQQIMIVDQLLLIRKDFNWFEIAGRLLKVFDVDAILILLDGLTKKGERKVKSLSYQEYQVIPYLTKAIQNKTLLIQADEYKEKAKREKAEHKKDADVFIQKMEERGLTNVTNKQEDDWVVRVRQNRKNLIRERIVANENRKREIDRELMKIINGLTFHGHEL